MKSLVTISHEHNFHPSYRADIDGLRAIAILSVVCFHVFPNTLRGGFVGVDIFFVISGFLISSIIFKSLQRDKFSFLEFYAHRVKRIFPALIVVLAACFIFGRIILLPNEFQQLSKHIVGGAGFIQNYVLWKEAGYFDTASELKPLMHLWSLAIEEQFYLLYPLLIWVIWRMGFNILAIVILIAALSFILNISWIKEYPIKTFFLAQTRFWELLIGAVLASLKLNKNKPNHDLLGYFKCISFLPKDNRLIEYKSVASDLLAASGFTLILASVVLIDSSTLFPGWWALAPVMGAFFLIVAGPEAFINRNLLGSRVMVFVGVISYPLYLWHWPIISFLKIIESGTPSLAIRATGIIVSILLAWLTFRLVESPIRFGEKTWKKTAIPIALMIIIGGAGLERFTSLKEQAAVGPVVISDTYCKEKYHPKGDLCRMVTHKDPTIMIIGDSHAYRLFLSLQASQLTGELDDNVQLLGTTACPVPSSKNHSCNVAMGQALEIAELSNSVHTVILASVTVRHYIENNRFPDDSNPYSTWTNLLRETINRLESRGKKVVVVIDNPMLDFDPKSCDIRPFRINKNHLRTDCFVSRENYMEREQYYRSAVIAALSKSKASIVDTSDVLCNEKQCQAIDGGQLLYDDNHHLTIKGATLVTKEILKRL